MLRTNRMASQQPARGVRNPAARLFHAMKCRMEVRYQREELMNLTAITVRVGCMFALVLASGCDGSDSTAPPVSLETTKRLDIGICAPGLGFTVVSTNRWFPMDVGRQLILEGKEEGETHTNQVTVLNVTRTIEGVVTRVVEEREFVNGVLSEVTWNYHVQA